jgi:glycosyltransferase involved in cell wall biosynthesis
VKLTIDTVVQFFPRGGSAQVIRYLANDFIRRGHSCRILCGSLGNYGELSHAASFYQGLDVAAMDYTPAAIAYAQGGSGMDGQPAPFHPSYEDRGSKAPDRLFTAVSPRTVRHLIEAWSRHLTAHRNRWPDIIHVHHLSHLQAAVARAYPDVARVTTLHGTDLKLLDQTHRNTLLAATADVPLTALAQATHPAELDRLLPTSLDPAIRRRMHEVDWRHWAYADVWATCMRAYAGQIGNLVVVSPSDQREAARLLDIPPSQITVIPNGVNTTRFIPQHLSEGQRLALLRRWLVQDPQGWAPGQAPGSIRYTDEDIGALLDSDGRLRPLVLWVGRYQKVKRLTLLLEAFATVIKESSPAPALLLWGGYPGEAEGEHPYDTVRRLGLDRHVYLLGWRGHDELPAGLNCADLMAAPAVNESFGLVYIEAAACGVPPIATATGGPASVITDQGRNADGWLVQPDDVEDLTKTLLTALASPRERARRADNALRNVRRNYAWSRIADRYQELYEQAHERR